MHLRHLFYLLAAATLTDVSLAEAPALSDNLSAINRGSNDYFGQAVAISGNTMVVGAPFEDSSASGVNSNLAASPDNNSAINAGAAYVYVRNTSGVWALQAYLKASNTGAGDQFGFSVAVSGDTIVIGAFAEASKATGVGGAELDNTAPNAGAAYVFVRTGSIWRQQAYLKASNTEASDLFGYSVAISGDSIVVGAFGEASGTTSESDNTLLQAGAAYVFTRSSGIWTQQDYLKASNPGRADLFGIAVGISDDSIVVGASGEASGFNNDQSSNSAASAGAAYVFTRFDSVWIQEDYLKASNIGASDFFGRAVAISGDSIIVGAPQEDSSTRFVAAAPSVPISNNSAANAGAAYIFTRELDSWSGQQYLKASDAPAANDNFGVSVALDKNTAIVGANGRASRAGVAFPFTRKANAWSDAAKLAPASGSKAADNFGVAIALSGDTGVVGASGEAGPLPAKALSGSTYVFKDLGPKVPEITVKNAAKKVLESDDSLEFLALAISVDPQVITITNTGIANLTGIEATIIDGAGEFEKTTNPLALLGPGGTTSFTIRMIGSGAPTATLRITSNDPNTPEFILELVGNVFSETADFDGDGLSDYAEYQMRSLGFDWQVKQTALVTTLKENGSLAGLAVIKLPVPLLTKNATTGRFTLSIAIQRSLDLKTFSPFLITADQAVFSAGKVELTFPALDNQGFYRLQTE